jgi:5'-deoxynucleotidase YfbR-like HD superfamily hydrolase
MSTNFWKNNAPLMDLHKVSRWSMLPDMKRQSVAEHSYRVWVIATHLYDLLFPVPHNSFNREMLREWALIHDADEHWLGVDLPSQVKKQMKAVSPAIFDKLADKHFKLIMPRYLEVKRGIHGTVEEAVVKIADIAEAMSYLKTNMPYFAGSEHSDQWTLYNTAWLYLHEVVLVKTEALQKMLGSNVQDSNFRAFRGCVWEEVVGCEGIIEPIKLKVTGAS